MPGRAANLIVWRKSILTVIVLFSCIALLCNAEALVDELVQVLDLRATASSCSKRLIDGKDPAELDWTYQSFPSEMLTGPTILGHESCTMLIEQPGLCLWPNRSYAETACRDWSRCTGFSCISGERFECQAHGNAPTRQAVRQPTIGVTSYMKFPESYEVENFKSYTKRLYSLALARIRTGSAVAALCCNFTVFLCALLSFGCSFRALQAWDRYVISRKMVFVGWFLIFMGPMFVSFLPLRLFMDKDGFARAVDSYATEFKQQFNVDEQLVYSLRLCSDITKGDYDEAYLNSVQNLEQAISTICSAIRTFVPQRIDIDVKYELDVPCIANVDVDFHEHHDFTPIHRACALAQRDVIAVGSHQALASVKDACMDYASLVAGNH
eukprot:SAG31_NODE_5723_length_2359_cov_1.837168_3_plen_382_part_00